MVRQLSVVQTQQVENGCLEVVAPPLPPASCCACPFRPIASRRHRPATFALVMLATTAHGDAYTFAELQATFARAGFVRSEFHALAPTTQQAVVSFT
jgi:hypothetical protein